MLGSDCYNLKFMSQYLNYSQKTRVWHILIVMLTMTVITPSAIANPLGRYCLSQMGQRPEAKSNSSTGKLAEIVFDVEGESFRIVANNHDRLLVMQGKETTPISTAKAPQPYGVIANLSVNDEGWLWIDGESLDYTASLSLDRQPPILGTPVAIPELYSDPCSFLSRWWGNCWMRVGGKYSPTLGRAFVSGHRPTFWGRASWVSYEVSVNETKILPEQLQEAVFMAELPSLGGVLFKGTSGEALFYDGVTVVDLFSNYSTPLPKNSWEIWGIRSTQNPERTFLLGHGSRKSPAMLAELRTELELIPISLPEKVTDQLLRLFTLPNDPRLWAVARNSVLAEVEGELQTVVTVPEPYYIEGAISTGQTSDGFISFVLWNKDTNSSTDYFLRYASPTAQCKVTLNTDEPISLDNP